MMNYAVIGGGSWGTALASVLAERHPVTLWARDPEVVSEINSTRRNPRYQSQFELSSRIRATASLRETVVDADLVLLVVPSHVMRTIAHEIAPDLKSGAMIVSASKGIENESLETMEEVLLNTLPRSHRADLAFLSGPSFAQETLARHATAVTIASRFIDVARSIQTLISTPYFRVYTTEDVTGVELGGALKNVIAIASGVADGLGLGHNSRAALMTRGVAEISRLAVAMGANPLTLSGLSGMGDLVLTCTGGLSRNRRVGVELGRGRTLSEIIDEMNEVAEGVKTAKSAYMLSQREGVDMPITQEVYSMLYEDKSPRLVLRDLMERSPKRERDH
jgi:glycerol-3-phosphate dehydrogenase (NAD(P)+)